MKTETLEQQKAGNFLKEAFCVDGQSKFVKELLVQNKTAIMYELSDSKRGTFFITISK